MLGKLDWPGSQSYIDRAGKEYKYFDIDEWSSISGLVSNDRNEIFRINKQFIDNAKRSGNTFYLSHDPFNSEIRTGFYEMELDYIEDILNGIIKPVDTNLWIVEF